MTPALPEVKDIRLQKAVNAAKVADFPHRHLSLAGRQLVGCLAACLAGCLILSYIYIYIYIYTQWYNISLSLYIYIYIYIYIYLSLSLYMCIYIYIILCIKHIDRISGDSVSTPQDVISESMT